MSTSTETFYTTAEPDLPEDGSHAWLGLLLLGLSGCVSVRLISWAISAAWTLAIQ